MGRVVDEGAAGRGERSSPRWCEAARWNAVDWSAVAERYAAAEAELRSLA